MSCCLACIGKMLAVQASSGQFSSTERQMFDNEYQSLLAEIDRIAITTKFAGNLLVNGSVEVAQKANKWQGRNVTRWRNEDYDRTYDAADTELDPVKRAALFIKMNDMVVQSAVVIPVTWRNVLHAAANSLAGAISFTGANVALTNTKATILAASNATGNLVVSGVESVVGTSALGTQSGSISQAMLIRSQITQLCATKSCTPCSAHSQ